MVFKENTGLKKILWLFLVLLLFAALFVFVYINPFPAMMEVFSPLFGGGNVTIGGTKYPASSKSITAVISRWDMEELDRFTQLESLDLRGSSCYQEITGNAVSLEPDEILLSSTEPLPTLRRQTSLFGVKFKIK